ncbi:MAG: hypothetical protein ACLU37_03190 [Collinsella sp.]
MALVQNRPSLAVVAYRDLAEDEVLVRHLPTCWNALCGGPSQYSGQYRGRSEPAYHRDGRPSLHGCLYQGTRRRVPGRQDCRAYRAPVSIR